MIKTEVVTIGSRSLIYTYSDANRYIVRDGVSYREAYDPIDSVRAYTEGEIIEEDATGKDYLEALAKLGVSEHEEA